MKSTSFFFLSCTTIILLFRGSFSEISDLRKCADELCEEKISVGHTSQRYNSLNEEVLSFHVDEKVNVYSKEAGTNQDLWGVVIRGSRGYAPKSFITEEKVFIKDDRLTHVVPTLRNTREENAPDKTKTQHKDDPESSVIEESGSTVSEIILNASDAEYEYMKNIHKEVVSQRDESGSKAVSESGEDTDISSQQKTDQKISDGKPSSGPIALDEELEQIKETATHLPSTEIATDDQAKVSSLVHGNEKEEDKELDNDEGNGNEGEENGNALDIKSSIDRYEAEKPVESSQTEVQKETLPPSDEPHSVSLSPSSVAFDIGSEVSSTDGIKLSDSTSDANEKSGQHVPYPSPHTYTVFEGTTIYQNENESFEPSDKRDLQDKQSSMHMIPPHLKATQVPVVEEKIHVKPTPVYDATENPTASVPEDAKSPEGREAAFIKETVSVSHSSTSVIPDAKQESSAQLPSETQETSMETDPEATTGKDSDLLGDVSVHQLVSQKVDHVPSDLSDNVEFATPKPESVLVSSEYEDALDSESDIAGQSGFLSTFFPISQVEHRDSASCESISKDQDSEISIKIEELESNNNDHGAEPVIGLPAEELLDKIDNDNDQLEGKTNGLDYAAESDDSLLHDLHFIDPSEVATKPNSESHYSESVNDKQNTSGDVISPSDPAPEVLQDATYEDDKASVSEMAIGAMRPLLDGLSNLYQLSEGLNLAMEGELLQPHLSAATLTFLAVVSGTVVILYLIHLIIVKFSRESPLLNMMNKLDREHRLLFEENNNLKKNITINANGQIKTISPENQIEISRLRNELQSSKFLQSQLEEEIEELKKHSHQLESDLEASATNEEELHRMLDELLSNQKDTQNFEESVNSLQMMLDSQREKVESLTSDLAHKTRLNEELRNELKYVKTRSVKLEHQIEQLTQSLEEMNSLKNESQKRLEEEESALGSLREINNLLRQEADDSRKTLEEQKAYTQNLQDAIRNLQQKLNSKDAECQVSRECLKKLQLHSDEGGNNLKGKLADLFKIVEVKAQLVSSEKGHAEAENELKKREEQFEVVNGTLKSVQQQNEEMRESLTKMKAERDEAKSKLLVLTQYYEEKETNLKKALESQEELRQDAEGSCATISCRIQSYEVELTSCREQIKSLKLELEEQKKSYKIQLTNEEKKLHESWLTARTAERRQEELRQENTQLRQRLTQMQREADQNFSLKTASKRGEANGSVSSPVSHENDVDGIHSSPMSLPPDFDGTLPPPHIPPMLPHMFPRPPHIPPGLPPPHPGMPPFIAPLPHAPPLPDRRLPPAGRIASPPGYDRRSYSPGSDHSHYSDHYSPGRRYSPSRGHKDRSPDRRSERSRWNANYRHRDAPSPTTFNRHSPDRWYSRSPNRFSKQRHSPHSYYNNEEDAIDDDRKPAALSGKRTVMPLCGINDR